MKQPQEISVLIAFVAGFLSFISPCVLPLVPSYDLHYWSFLQELALGEKKEE
jgi:cytochrome c biogenesis protein CcdA